MADPIFIIKDWQKGVAGSPHLGFGSMKKVDIAGFPGSVRPSLAPTTCFHTAYSSTFTADAGTDICTASETVPITGTAVTVSNSGGALPTGLSASTNYFIIKLSSTTFKLATTIANANSSTAIDITGAGTGTHTVTTVNPGTVNHIVEDPRTDTQFGIDSNGRVWYGLEGSQALLLNGNTLTNAAGKGIALLRTSDGNATYLFAFRNAIIDVVNVFGTSQKEAPSWTNGWQTMNSGAGSGNSHHAINAQDGIIYFCDDRYVGSIKENSGSVFDPGTGATYTYNNQALDLPLGTLTNWLEELGTNLMIVPSNQKKLYPWDRVSDSFSLPLPLPEKGNKAKNMGNIIYILAGTHGNIYQTQGSYVRPFFTVPEYLSNNSQTGTSSSVTWGGIDATNNALYVGIGTQTSGNSGVLKILEDGTFVIDSQPTTGSSVTPTAIYAPNEFYTMGYSGGADQIDTSRYGSLAAVVESGLYRLAGKVEKTKVSQLEIVIAKPVAGQVRVGYRTDLTTSFTTIVTQTTDTSNISYTADIGLTDIEQIQIQAELTAVDLMELRFYE